MKFLTKVVAAKDSMTTLSDSIAALGDLRRQLHDESGAASKPATDKIQKAIDLLHEAFTALQGV